MISTLDVGAAPGFPNADPREARSPVWSRDGDEIIYYYSGGSLVRVPVSIVGTFVHGTPEVLLGGGGAVSARGPHYDVAPDGGRIVLIQFQPLAETMRNELVVVHNWAEELTARPRE